MILRCSLWSGCFHESTPVSKLFKYAIILLKLPKAFTMDVELVEDNSTNMFDKDGGKAV